MSGTLQNAPAEARAGWQPWVARHPLTSFFTLALGISGVLWGVIPAVLPLGPGLRGWLAMVGSLGPAVSALCVTRLLSQERTPPAPSRVRFAVFLGIWVLGLLGALGLTPPREEVSQGGWVALLVLVALVPAIVLDAGLSGHRGAREWLSALHPRCVGAGWLLLALLLMPALALLQLGWDRLLGRPTPVGPTILEEVWTRAPLLPFVLFLEHFVFGGPLGEEPGWRGFALRHLQARHSPLVASLLLGIPWWLWHVPLQLNDFEGGYASGLLALINRLVFNVPFATLFTWLYNRTRGSLLPVLLLHFSNNETTALTGGYPSMPLLLFVLGGLVLADRMWRRLPADSPCVARSSPRP